MGDSCFMECKSLKKVTLPQRDLHMDKCFNGCPAIEILTVNATLPYPFPQTCFLDVDRSRCTLFVPKGSLESYRESPGWKDFAMIKEIEETGTQIMTAEESKLNVRTGIGSIKIYTDVPTTIAIYNTQGNIIRSYKMDTEKDIEIPGGIYIISNGQSTVKVTVR